MLEDYSAQRPLMEWNTQKKTWQYLQDNRLFEQWEPFLGIWQTSGTMRNGQVFELPMQERLTTASEFLSSPILRTPTASQGEGGALGEEEARKRGNTVGIRDQAMDLAKLNGQQVSRNELNLMPTPNTMDHLPARTPEQKAANKGKGGYANVRETVVNDLMPTNWGKFEPAIRRWEEVLGRAAPAPTKPDGKKGAHRLSSAFTEWMMGLPAGWITEVGLTRNEELKACGNGVVPQQAELALRVLLEGVSIPAGGGQVNLPTPTVSDTYTDNLKSTQQKEGSMHSVTLPQAVRWVAPIEKERTK